MNKRDEIERLEKKGGKILGKILELLKIEENKWWIRKSEELYKFNDRLSNVIRKRKHRYFRASFLNKIKKSDKKIFNFLYDPKVKNIWFNEALKNMRELNILNNKRKVKS